MAKRKKARFKLGQMVRTKYYTPGVPFGISAEMLVEIKDVLEDRFPAEPRYKISYCGGSGLWVGEDVLEELGGPR